MNPCTTLCRTLNAIPPAQGGTYLVVLWLRATCEATIGRFGAIRFPRGYYSYIGSAKRGLAARLHRHVHGASTRHWHIDYLRPHARVLAWCGFAGTRYAECTLAQTLLPWGEAAYPRFGASDCSCPAHLIYYPHRADVFQALQQLTVLTAPEKPLVDLNPPACWYDGTRAGFPLVQTMAGRTSDSRMRSTALGAKDHALHENARVR